MTTLVEQRSARLRLTLSGLRLSLGYPGGQMFSVLLEPAVAVALANDLLDAVAIAHDAGHEALGDLRALVEVNRDG